MMIRSAAAVRKPCRSGLLPRGRAVSLAFTVALVAFLAALVLSVLALAGAVLLGDGREL